MSLRRFNKWLPQAWFKYGYKVRRKRNVCLMTPSGIRLQEGKSKQAPSFCLSQDESGVEEGLGRGAGASKKGNVRSLHVKQPLSRERNKPFPVGSRRFHSLWWQPLNAAPLLTPLCSTPWINNSQSRICRKNLSSWKAKCPSRKLSTHSRNIV